MLVYRRVIVLSNESHDSQGFACWGCWGSRTVDIQPNPASPKWMIHFAILCSWGEIHGCMAKKHRLRNSLYETWPGLPTSIFWRHAVEELSRGLSSLCWIMAVGCWARENVLLIGVHYPISWENPNHHWLYIIYINISVTIWLFNIAMENHHF